MTEFFVISKLAKLSDTIQPYTHVKNHFVVTFYFFLLMSHIFDFERSEERISLTMVLLKIVFPE